MQRKLTDEIIKRRIQFIGIADPRTKGRDTKKTLKFVLTHTGTAVKEKEKHWLGFIVKTDTTKNSLELQYKS